MLCELYDAQRNPMDLIRVKGSTKRGRKPIILSPDDFHRMLRYISAEPYRTMVIVALCLGVRRSELIALKWSDFDWLNNTVMIQRSMVDTRTGEVKTEYSARPLPLDPAVVALFASGRSTLISRLSPIGCGLLLIRREPCPITQTGFNGSTSPKPAYAPDLDQT